MGDTKPLESAYRALQWTLALCATLVVMVMLGVFGYALQSSVKRCDEVQAIRAYILQATERGLETLPTLAYYKEHPDELAVQLDNLQRQRAEFAQPLRCSIL